MMWGNAMTKKFRPLAIGLALAALLLALPADSYAKKKKKKTEESAPQKKSAQIDHSRIDTSKLVWPLPPDIPRIKFMQEVIGEDKPTPPPDQTAPKKKKKQSWMDRVAGIQTTDSGAPKQELKHFLGKPYGVSGDSKGRIYVADSFVSAVFIYDFEKHETKLLRNGIEAKFAAITGITVDAADRVFVSDSEMHRIAVFSPNWKIDNYFGADELKRPTGVAVDDENRFVYVVDTEKQNVAVFDADSFKFLRTVGGPPKSVGDEDPGTFSKPTNVAVDKEGNVYVTDTLNNRVQIFDADGKFISMFGKAGDGPSYFARPKGIAIDPDGHIWVAESFMNRVQIYDREGHLLAYFGSGGSLPGQFGVPTGVYVDKQNRAFVTEQLRGRLQVFRYITDAEAKTLKEEQTKRDSAAVSAQSASQDAVPAEKKQ